MQPSPPSISIIFFHHIILKFYTMNSPSPPPAPSNHHSILCPWVILITPSSSCKWSNIYYYLLVNVYTHFYLIQDWCLMFPFLCHFRVNLNLHMLRHLYLGDKGCAHPFPGRLALKESEKVGADRILPAPKFASFNRCVATFRSCTTSIHHSSCVFIVSKLGCQIVEQKGPYLSLVLYLPQSWPEFGNKVDGCSIGCFYIKPIGLAHSRLN